MSESNKTTYVVETRFSTKDESSKQLHEIGHAAGEAHEETKNLKEALKEVGEAFLLFEAVEKAKEGFIGLNSEVQQARLQLTGVVGANWKKPWDDAREAANGLFEDFDRFEKVFPVSAEELASSARDIAVAVSEAGGTMEDLRILTEKASVAQKAFGLDSRQMMMMLEGHVSNRAPGAKALLNMIGMNADAWQKLSAQQRLAKVEGAMRSDNMNEIQNALAGSFAGQATILKANVEDFFKSAGLPLFKAINEELQHWNEWLEKNKEKVEQISHVVAEKMVHGFEIIKDVGTFLYDHSDVLIKIAEAWAAVKVGGMMGEIKGGGEVGKVLGDVIGKGIAGYAIGGFGGGLVGGGMAMGGMQGKLLGAGGVGYMIGEQIMKAGLGDTIQAAIDPTMAKFRELRESMEQFDKAMEEGAEEAKKNKGAAGTNTAGHLQALNEMTERQINVLRDVQAGRLGSGLLGKANSVAALKSAGFDSEQMESLMSGEGRSKMIEKLEKSLDRNKSNLSGATSATDVGIKFALDHMTKDQREQLDVAKATQQIMQEQLALMASGQKAMSPEQVAASLIAAQEIARINGVADAVGAAKINQTVNVHIDQVSAKDPDRWLADLDDYAARRVRSRTRAKNAPARGH